MATRRGQRAQRSPTGAGSAGGARGRRSGLRARDAKAKQAQTGGRRKQQEQQQQQERKDHRAGALRRGEVLHDKLNNVSALKSTHTLEEVQVEIPAFDGIHVEVQAPPRPGDAEIDERIDELCRAHAPMRPREAGEGIELGDEILVDAVGYAWGELFSSQMNEWLLMAENPLLPGLFEQLVGTPVGTHTVVTLTLPESYPDPELAGASAAFAVDVKAANAALSEVEASVLLKELGYGETEAEQRAAVKTELEEVMATEMVNEARARVLDELYARAPGHVPEAMVEAELQREFRALEGEHLARAGVSIDEMNAVFEAFISDPERRRAVRRRLWEGHFLDALITRLRIGEDKGDLLKLMTRMAASAGLTATTMHSALRKDEEAADELVVSLRRSRAIERVLEQVEVSFLAQAS